MLKHTQRALIGGLACLANFEEAKGGGDYVTDKLEEAKDGVCPQVSQYFGTPMVNAEQELWYVNKPTATLKELAYTEFQSITGAPFKEMRAVFEKDDLGLLDMQFGDQSVDIFPNLVALPPNELISHFQIEHDTHVKGMQFTSQSGANFGFSTRQSESTVMSPTPMSPLEGPIIGFSFMFEPATQRAIQIATVVNTCACHRTQMLNDRPPANMSIYAGSPGAEVQLVLPQIDLIGHLFGQDCLAGYALEIQPDFPMLTITQNVNAAGEDQLSLKSDTLMDVGVYNLMLHVLLVNSNMTDFAYPLTVTVTPCPLESISVTPVTPIELTYTVFIDPPLENDPISFEQLMPQCPGFGYSSAISNTPTPSFVTQAVDSGGMPVPTVFKVSTSDSSFAGEYEWTVRYTVTYQTEANKGWNPSETMVAEQTIKLTVLKSCLDQVVDTTGALEYTSANYSVPIDASQKNTQPRSIKFTPFTSDMPIRCPLTYTSKVFHLNSTLTEKVIVFDPVTNTISWPNVDISHKGQWILLIEATNSLGLNTSTVTFILNVDVGCQDATLTLDPAIIPDTISYYISDPAKEIQIDRNLIYSSHSTDRCPKPLVVDIVDANGDPVDAALFNFDGDVLEVQSSDVTTYLDNLVHNLTLKVYYEGQDPDLGVSQNFQVILDHIDCSTLSYPDLKISDCSYQVMFPMNPCTWSFADTECGPWQLLSNTDLKLSQGSAQFNEFDLVIPVIEDADAGQYLMNATYTIPNTKVQTEVSFTVDIQSCVPTLVQPVPVTNQTFVLFEQTLSIEFDEFVQTPMCLSDPMNYESYVLDSQGQTIDASSFLNKNGTRTFDVQTNDQTLVGSYSIIVQPQYPAGVLRSETLIINLDIVDPCQVASFDIPQNVLIDRISVPEAETEADYTFSLIDSISHSKSQSQLCGPIEMKILTIADNGQQKELFDPNISIEETGPSALTVKVNSTADPTGELISLRAVLIATLADFPGFNPFVHEFTIEYRVEVPVIEDPVIEDPIIEDPEPEQESGYEKIELPELGPMVINCDQETVYDLLPEFMNQTGQRRPIAVDFDNITSEFAFYDLITGQVFVQNTLLKERHEGIHKAKVRVTQGSGKFEQILEQTLEIEVQCRSEKSEEPVNTKEESSQEKPQEPSTQQSKRTETGREIPLNQVKNITDFQIKESTDLGAFDLRQPVPRLQSVSQTGLIRISWDKQMIVPLDLKAIKEKKYVIYNKVIDGRRRLSREWFDTDAEYLRYLLIVDALDIEISSLYEDGASEELDFTWELESFEEQYLEIQLYFSKPELVSTRFAVDTIKVTFFGTEFFKSHDIKQEVQYGTTLQANIVRQTSSEDFTAPEISVITYTLQVLMVLSLVVFAFSGQNLLTVWMLFTSLQIIAHLILLPSFVPTQLYIVLKSILNILRLNFGHDQPGQQNFDGSDQKLEFIQAGYSEDTMSSNITLALFMTFIASIAIVILVVVAELIGKPKCTRPTKSVANRYLMQALRKVVSLAVLVFALCSFEMILGSLISIEIGASDSNVAYLALILSVLIFVVPLISCRKFDQRFNPSQSTDVIENESPEQKEQSKEKVAENGYQDWLEGADLETQRGAETQRALLNENIPIKNLSAEGQQDKESELLEGGQSEEKLSEDNSTRLQRMKAVVTKKLSHESNIKEKQSITRFILFFGRKITRHSLALLVLFVVRLTMICVAIVCVESYSIQLSVALLCSLAYYCAIVHCQRHLWVEQSAKWIHFLNEALILVFLSTHYIFSAYAIDIDARNKVGVALVYILVAHLLIHMIILVYASIRLARLVILRHYNRAQRAKKTKQQQPKLQESEVSEEKEDPEALRSRLGSPVREHAMNRSVLMMSPRASCAVTPMPDILDQENSSQQDEENNQIEIAMAEYQDDLLIKPLPYSGLAIAQSQLQSDSDQAVILEITEEIQSDSKSIQVTNQLDRISEEASQFQQSTPQVKLVGKFGKEIHNSTKIQETPLIKNMQNSDVAIKVGANNTQVSEKVPIKKLSPLVQSRQEFDTLESQIKSTLNQATPLWEGSKTLDNPDDVKQLTIEVSEAYESGNLTQQLHRDSLQSNKGAHTTPRGLRTKKSYANQPEKEPTVADESSVAGNEIDSRNLVPQEQSRAIDIKQVGQSLPVKKIKVQQFDTTPVPMVKPKEYNMYGKMTEKEIDNILKVQASKSPQAPKAKQIVKGGMNQQKGSKWSLRRKSVAPSKPTSNQNSLDQSMMNQASAMHKTSAKLGRDMSLNESAPRPKTNLFAATALKSFGTIQETQTEDKANNTGKAINALYNQRKSVPVNQSKLFQGKRDSAAHSRVSSMSSATQIKEGRQQRRSESSLVDLSSMQRSADPVEQAFAMNITRINAPRRHSSRKSLK